MIGVYRGWAKKIPHLGVAKRDTGIVEQGWVCASTTQYRTTSSWTPVLALVSDLYQNAECSNHVCGKRDPERCRGINEIPDQREDHQQQRYNDRRLVRCMNSDFHCPELPAEH